METIAGRQEYRYPEGLDDVPFRMRCGARYSWCSIDCISIPSLQSALLLVVVEIILKPSHFGTSYT